MFCFLNKFGLKFLKRILNKIYKYYKILHVIAEVIFNESELAKSLDAMEAPGAEHDIPMETEDVAATAIAGLVIPTTGALSNFYDHFFLYLQLSLMLIYVSGGLVSESFTLEPLDAAAVAVAGIEKPGRPKRRRRLIVDEQKNISGDEMKGNMAEYRYMSPNSFDLYFAYFFVIYSVKNEVIVLHQFFFNYNFYSAHYYS